MVLVSCKLPARLGGAGGGSFFAPTGGGTGDFADIFLCIVFGGDILSVDGDILSMDGFRSVCDVRLSIVLGGLSSTLSFRICCLKKSKKRVRFNKK